MNEKEDRIRPPLICENCYRNQLHHPWDAEKRAYHCPHACGGKGAAVVWRGDRWIVVPNIGPDGYRTIMGAIRLAAIGKTAEQISRGLNEAT